MKTPKTWFALISMTTLIACGESASSPEDVSAPPSGGTAEESPPVVPPTGSGTTAPANEPGKAVHQLSVDGVDRSFIVYVPEKARGDTHAPIVMMLHGAAGDGEKFFQISGWREKADATGLIAVFPTALVHCWKKDENGDGDFDDPGEKNLSTIWASGDLGTKVPLCSTNELAQLKPADRALADHGLKSDLDFFRAMLDFMGASHSVDPKRFYVSGFSSGGVMASFLALEMADRLAAVAVNSGSLNAEPHLTSRPISIFRAMGEVEDVYEQAFGVKALPLSESVLTMFPTASFPGGYIHDKMHAPYLAALGLSDTYHYDELTLATKKVVRFTYDKSSTNTKSTFQSHIIQGLSHEYPNGKNHPVVMADVLWDFFQMHSL